MRQLRYAIDLIGAEHVGLSLDYVFDLAELDEFVKQNPANFWPGLEVTGALEMVAPESFGAIAEGLAHDNMTDNQIRSVMGGNWLRIAMQGWHPMEAVQHRAGDGHAQNVSAVR